MNDVWVCQNCLDGFYTDEKGGCSACGVSIPDCTACESATICTECSTGLFASSAGDYC